MTGTGKTATLKQGLARWPEQRGDPEARLRPSNDWQWQDGNSEVRPGEAAGPASCWHLPSLLLQPNCRLPA